MRKIFFALAPLACLVLHPAVAQNYRNHAQLSQTLRSLEASSAGLARLQSIAKTAGGRDIWLMEIGSGNRAERPAIAVVGGVEGAHLLGQELALQFIEKLLASAQTDSIKDLLANTTFYVYPAMSPDAAEQYFAALKYERSGNASPTDDDRDGKVDEDGFEDMDGDGLITMVRVADATGPWKVHPADARVMVLANKEKGERGTHWLYTEGTDNDRDKAFNEDGAGGVHFNKNLPFDPPFFGPGAGEHPVSEIENRALLDLLHEQANVFCVVSFGPANNLSEPWKFDRPKTTTRVVTGILEGDSKLNKMASELYKKAVTAKDAPAAPPAKGDFVQWAYFHYARLSFSTPGWWSPRFEVPKDTAAAKKYKANDDKNTEVDFLRWAEKEGLDVFVPWKKVIHPDFPGRLAEVGGFKPFVKNTPPANAVGPVATSHTQFLLALARARPDLELLNQKTEQLDNGVSRVTVTAHNRGLFPAVAEIGARNYWVKLVSVSVTLGKDQSLVGGNRVVVLDNLQPGESREISWLIRGKGTATIEGGAPQTGFKKFNVTL